MAKDAVIRSNPDETLVEIETPDGEFFGPEDWPDDGIMVCADDQDPSKCYLAVLDDDYGALKANTLYQLVPVSTLTEEVDDFEEETEEEEEEGEEGSAEEGTSE